MALYKHLCPDWDFDLIDDGGRMNKEKIIRMAREAAFSEPAHPFITWGASDEQLERFAALVAEHEREACAAICDRFQARDVGMQPAECAGAIRARGNT